MENSKLPPEIKERFLELPESVQKIIVESGWEETTREIVSKYNLRIDQGSFIETETMLIMFGFISADDFKKDLISEAKIDEETANKIEQDIGNNIFKLIKDKIRVVTEENIESKNSEEEVKQAEPEREKSEEDITHAENSRVDTDRTETTKEQGQNNLIEDNLSHEKVQQPKKTDPYLEPIE